MIILVKLILAHLIGDFLLQPDSWVKEKEAARLGSLKLYLHVLLHGALMGVLLWNLKLWGLVWAVMMCHFIIDTLKLYLQKNSNKILWFWGDQALHFISILGVYWIMFKPDWHLIPLLQSQVFWIGVTCLVFITAVAGMIIQMLMQQWAKELGDGADQSLRKAGKYIGILERLFIFIFVIYGQWEAIGFLLAAKSIFRFGDLKEAKDRKLTEYMLIGTLLSFGMATIIGLWMRYLIVGGVYH